MIDLDRVKKGKRYLLYTSCDLKRARIIAAVDVYKSKSGNKLGVVGETTVFNRYGKRLGLLTGGRYPAKSLCPFTAEVAFLFWRYEQIRVQYINLKEYRRCEKLEPKNSDILLRSAWKDLECIWTQLAFAFYKAGRLEHTRDDNYIRLPQ